MDEFNNRMDAQKRVLSIVNAHRHRCEELCGLSVNAIERWIRIDQCEPDGPVARLLKEISKRLFFLATKSQEQVTEDYQKLSSHVAKLTDDLEAVLG